MIKTIYIALVVSFFMIPTKGNSQERSVKDQITGTWLMDFDKTMLKINSESKMHLDTMQETQRDRVENLYKGRKVAYGTDGSYYRLLADGRSVSGSWTLISENNQIEITGPDGVSKLYLKIEQLEESQMVLRPVLDKDKKMTIPVWYYTKVKS